MFNSKAGAVARNLVLAVAAVLLALGSSAVTALEAEPASKGLFATPASQGSIDRSGEPTVIRSRYVGLNLGLLLGADGAPRDLAAGSTLALNFFDDATLVAVLDRVEPAYGGGFTWTGRVQDEPLSLVTLAVTDGIMAGTVSLPTALFEIGYAGNGVHAVYEIDQSAFAPEAAPIPVSIPKGEQDAAADAAPSAVADDGSIIDVMVVYTPAARSAVGDTTQMLNLINLAVTETNQTYSYSGIIQRLHLVRAAEVSYTETTFDAALYDLTNPSDGKMDIVHTLRNTYAADEVVLIVNNPQYCGLAWLMQTVTTAFEDHAFAVVNWQCATGYYSFGHELGHNMGAHHDYYAVSKYNQGSGAYWYSYGYVNTAQRWRTVMAYNDACADLGFNCTRIPFWSNPNVTYGGVPVGTASANNRLTLNNTAWTVANFRIGETPPSAPTGLTATPVLPWRINLAWTDTSSNETGFRIQRSLNSSTWSTLATVAANTTSYADTSPTPGTLYYYRVIAYNSAGDSPPSNVASATLPIIIGPLVYNGHTIDDDNVAGTMGNDNGYVNCGETVGLTVLLKNNGNTAVTAINTTLNFLGGTADLSSIGNTASSYPDIAGGATAGNLQAFQFEVKSDAEHGHWIDFQLAITASNWGPGSVNFSLPILCAATADFRFYLPLIFKN
jgi:hypothetical protein